MYINLNKSIYSEEISKRPSDFFLWGEILMLNQGSVIINLFKAGKLLSPSFLVLNYNVFNFPIAHAEERHLYLIIDFEIWFYK